MEITRIPAPAVCGESEALSAWLDFERATLIYKCAGLDSAAAARRTVPPSTLSLLGLVRHLTDAELRWFAERFEGRDVELVYRRPEDPDAAFNEAAGADLDGAIARWAEVCDNSRRVVAAASSMDQLSVGVRSTGDHFSLRWLMHHLITEYARHNGHADLLREATDGTVGS